ncbi:MAG: S9 family peptidase [Vicinamibacteria bacterium]|nr:S9 family peptidase [Vicinamibacteria bacterium]
MIKTISFTFFLCAALGAVSEAQPSPVAKRPIAETDVTKFMWSTDPEISADGRRVAFVKVEVNEKKDDYETSIWLGATDGRTPPRRFTAGPRDSGPRWSPDGTLLAFVRGAEKEGKRQPSQLFLIPMSGGEPRAITDLPKGASSATFSSDGKTLVFTSNSTDEDIALAKNPPKEPAREPDIKVVTQAVYRSNGGGYSDPTRKAQLWAVTLSDGSSTEPRRISNDPFGAAAPLFSKDGSTLYYRSLHVKEPYYEDSRSQIWSVPVAGGEPKRVLDFAGAIGDFDFSPDGKRLAFTAAKNTTPVRSHDQSDLFIADFADGVAGIPKNLTTAYDYDVGGGVGGDQAPPRGGSVGGIIWGPEGNSILVKCSEQGRANLKRIDARTGAVTAVTSGDQDVMQYSASADGKTLVALISTPTVLGDLHAVEAATGTTTRLSSFNDELFGGLDLTLPDDVWYTSFDGKKIHALVQRPPRFEAGKKYPLILNIHGGPHSAYGYTFFHEMQWMAAKGYVVLYPNPRGSTGYGQDFANIIQYHYPGDDAKDLLIGVDEMVKRGWADPAKLAVTGGSGGGVLTNWIVTQDQRFKAAASQRSIADWAGFWYTADFVLFQPSWFRAAPWQDPKDFAARSAITFVANVKTPLMLIEGEDDLRTPPSDGGEQMFRALKYLKIDTVMVRFPGETHELSRSGKPSHRIGRLRHIVGWFDKYIMGESKPEYDVR